LTVCEIYGHKCLKNDKRFAVIIVYIGSICQNQRPELCRVYVLGVFWSVL